MHEVWPVADEDPGPHRMQAVVGSESTSAVPAAQGSQAVAVAKAPAMHTEQAVQEFESSS